MTSPPPHESEGFHLFKGLLQGCALKPHWRHPMAFGFIESFKIFCKEKV